jgi:hypothetical protein
MSFVWLRSIVSGIETGGISERGAEENVWTEEE